VKIESVLETRNAIFTNPKGGGEKTLMGYMVLSAIKPGGRVTGNRFARKARFRTKLSIRDFS